MKDIITVMKFTIKDMVKRKSFIISTLIILILIVIGFNVPNVIKNLNGDNTGDKFLIVDNKNVFEGTLENLKQMDLGYEFEITNADLKFEDIKQKIEMLQGRIDGIQTQINDIIPHLNAIKHGTKMELFETLHNWFVLLVVKRGWASPEEKKEVKDGLTLPELIEQENVETPEYVTVSINDEFVATEDKESTVLKEGDNVEFLYFMGGGC